MVATSYNCFCYKIQKLLLLPDLHDTETICDSDPVKTTDESHVITNATAVVNNEDSESRRKEALEVIPRITVSKLTASWTHVSV